jgi:TRAP-type C4-dicarboxylate transport system substrate-binding protein
MLTMATMAAAENTMTIAHLYPDSLTDNDVAPSLAHFKQLVESATGGAIEVKVFGAGALGQEVETGKQVQTGKLVQSVLISSGAMSSFYKNYQIVTTPFLFSSYHVAWEFFDSEWFAEFMGGVLETSRLRYLGTLDDAGGFVAFTNNKRLIKTMDDVAGLNIRVEENPAHVATMRALGASATPLPWGEVHTALATGLADGQFNAPGVSKSFKLWEVNDYTTWSGHVFNTLTWLVSDAWLSALPDAHRLAVVRAARESVRMARGISTQMSVVGWAESCKRFKACHVLSESEKAKMRAVTRPAFKAWITGDFGIPAAEVEAMWAAVAQIEAELDRRARERYLR